MSGGIGEVDGSQAPPGGSAGVLDAIAAAAAAQMGGENFPVALRLVPARPRHHLERIYGFARFVDDVGDSAPGDRVALLDEIEADVRALWHGSPALAPVRALRPVLDDCAVPMAPLLDLVEANRVDQHVRRYETFEDLMGYCRLSAAPVGQLVLHVAGRATSDNVADSDAVCSGLQVLEHCQDVREDAEHGRIYLPGVDLRTANIGEHELRAEQTSGRVRGAISIQVARARDLLSAGEGLVRRLSGWSRFAVSGYVAGGLATADALEWADYDVLSHLVSPTRPDTARHAVRLLIGRHRG